MHQHGKKGDKEDRLLEQVGVGASGGKKGTVLSYTPSTIGAGSPDPRQDID